MSEIISTRNDINEGDKHIEAKNIISLLLSKKSISLTNHKNETIYVNPNDIKSIIQEFTWFVKQKNPMKSFIADIAIIDYNDNIIAVIEVVQSHRISPNKYSFYESLNIFWLEIPAHSISLDENDFYSPYVYNTINTKNYNSNSFVSELEFNSPKYMSPRNLILHQISRINNLIKKSKNVERTEKLKIKKEYYVDQILTKYQKKIRKIKYENQEKIKSLLETKKQLLHQRYQLKSNNLPYTSINLQIKQLKEDIEKLKIEHLSGRQLKLRDKNIQDTKKYKKSKTKILKIENKKDPCIDIFNTLERLSKTLKSDTIDLEHLRYHFQNKSIKLGNLRHTERRLKSLGWILDNNKFSRKQNGSSLMVM